MGGRSCCPCREIGGRMTTLAEAMRRWREVGIAPLPMPAATMAEAQRLIRLEFAERRVRTLCPDETSAACILALAPEDNGTDRRAVHLEAAARAIAKGW